MAGGTRDDADTTADSGRELDAFDFASKRPGGPELEGAAVAIAGRETPGKDSGDGSDARHGRRVARRDPALPGRRSWSSSVGAMRR